jgi:hypothetical protein
VELGERFIAVDEKFRSLALPFEQFGTRMTDAFHAFVIEVRTELRIVGPRLDQNTERLDRVIVRMDKLEEGLANVNVRVDGFSEDMRQRFRVLNERIGELAA